MLSSVTCVAEVVGGALQTYKGGWDNYEEQRKMNALTASRVFEKNEKKAADLQQFIDKWGAGTKSTQANSKKKALEKLKAEMGPAPPPMPSEDGGPGAERRNNFLQLPQPPPAPEELLLLKDVSVGYGSGDSDAEPILSGVNLEVPRGARMVLLGPNGAGKSTLLKAIGDRLPVKSGMRTEGKDKEGGRLKMGIFSQDLAQELDLERTALEEVMERVPLADEQSVRNTLGALGLTGNAALRLIGYLSGGEKARVALAVFAQRPANLLLLDEPNNHLDTAMLEVLEEGLSAKSWPGALIVSSHSRPFCEALEPTHVVHVAHGSVTVHERGLMPSDWTWLQQVAATNKADSAEPGEEPVSKQEQKEKRNAVQKLRKRIPILERKIEKEEAIIAKFDQEIIEAGNDWQLATEIGDKRSAAQAKVDAWFEELVEVEESLNAD